MTKKWMAISVLLFIVAGVLGWILYASTRKFNIDGELEKLQPSQDMMQKIAWEKSLPQLPPPKGYIPEEFAVIPEHNLFTESRGGGEEGTADADLPDAQPLSQKPVLVGINITDNQKTALLVDPKASSQGRNRRAEIKRIGDVFEGYTISDIAPDHIVLGSGSRKEIIPLHEGSKQTSGGRTPILSTRVVSFGGRGASGGSPISASVISAAAPQSTAAPKSIPVADSQAKTAAKATASVTPARQTRTQTSAGEPSSQQTRTQQQSPATDSSGPKTRVIRTPFGDIVRPVQD
jgi:hypothetical protein